MVSVGLAKTSKEAVKLGACSHALFCIYTAVRIEFVEPKYPLMYVSVRLHVDMSVCILSLCVSDCLSKYTGIFISMIPILCQGKRW